MDAFPAVLFFGVVFLLFVPRLGLSAGLPVIVTIVPLAAAVYMVFSHAYSPYEERWAFATAAVIIGYWLKPEAR